ncbi:MAG TPA: hypothetical protein VK911_09150, partial [Vicinamibacterales bacterium]|nr:hypothetical protein [Vicinamibacterales bacterium]
MLRLLLVAGLVGVLPSESQSQSQSESQSRSESQSTFEARGSAGSGLDPVRLARIEDLVHDAIEAKQLPGAVIVVGRGDEVLYQRAFG